MYHFAIVALLALGCIKAVDFVVDNLGFIGLISRMRSLLMFLAAFGAVWALDYSFFDGLAIEVRNHATGVWLTGVIVAGLTVPWRAVFGWLTHDRATVDETLGDHTTLRRAA